MRLADARRIAVKIGSSSLVESAGAVRRGWLGSVAADIAAMRGMGQELIVVSSGAIALGRRRLGLPSGVLRLDQAQAAASVGQIALAQSWTQALGDAGLVAAQVLLTLDDTEDRRRYLNARATLGQLLALGAVPVINENDTVATAEIRYGDNDRLAARVAAMAGCDACVLLSDVDGLYTENPARNPAARHLADVAEITPEIEAMAGGAGSDMGSGGMATKVMAAKIATAAGCALAIADGRPANPLRALAEGARATWFTARANPAAARKQWILGAMKPAGTLTIDAGAETALRAGKSLLPAGVRSVEGLFERGDLVAVRNGAGTEIARGLAAYGTADAGRIAGRRSADIEALLGFRGRDEMIHRDDLALL
jgi:glutamate 5-kinase